MELLLSCTELLSMIPSYQTYVMFYDILYLFLDVKHLIFYSVGTINKA